MGHVFQIPCAAAYVIHKMVSSSQDGVKAEKDGQDN